MKRSAFLTGVLLAVSVSLGTASCAEDKSFKTPEWSFNEPQHKDSTSTSPQDSTGQQESPFATGKRFYIWVDASANFPDFANSRENIARDLGKAAEAGFTDIIVDVRPTTGDVLFKTELVQQVEYLGAWTTGGYKKFTRTADWDYLQAFIDEGHKLGLRIHAGFNTMVGGNQTSLGQSGMLFRDGDKRDWGVCYNLSDGIVNTMDAGVDNTKFLNPANPKVCEFLLGLIGDLAAYEELDGIVLDRCRYTGLQSDFSDLSRRAFESYAGVSLAHWPEDVLPRGADYNAVNASGFKAPTYYKRWLEWRASVIHDFIEAASELVHATNPRVQFGVYVGGWYSQYYDVGVNWASPDYNTAAYYSKWASNGYRNTGYADHCDQILIGAYANPTAIFGSSEWTMQGFCSLAKKKIGNGVIVCGGPDVGNWNTGGLSDSELHTAVENTVKPCYDACDGYFCFDMIHVKKSQYWDDLKAGIDAAANR